MTPSSTDRRRFFLATGLTLLALPALWLVSRSADSGAPNVATAGIGVGETEDGSGEPAVTVPRPEAAAEPADAPAAATTPTVPPTVPPTSDGPDQQSPVFLDGPSAGGPAGVAEIAVPAAPAISSITTEASYSSAIAPADTCLVAEVPTGRTITVVNLDNGRSVTCVATRTFGAVGNGLTMHADLFAEIADLTDAPIPVEIRQ